MTVEVGRQHDVRKDSTVPKTWGTPILLALSAVMMALAWLGHLRFESTWSFWTALAASWALVLPEYALNTAATRWGYGTYSGAQMAAIHLSAGVVCVALISNVLLDEPVTLTQLTGYGVLIAGIFLIFAERPARGSRSESGDKP